LILRLEGGNFDPVFCERLYNAGRGYPAPGIPDMADNDDLYSSNKELQEAWQRKETEGQRFQQQIMACLFNSESSRAVRRPR